MFRPCFKKMSETFSSLTFPAHYRMDHIAVFDADHNFNLRLCGLILNNYPGNGHIEFSFTFAAFFRNKLSSGQGEIPDRR